MFVPAAVALTSYAKYTAETCPYKAQPNECECWNNNDALDFGAYPGPEANVTWRDFHGADYGKWCAAWEDGKRTPGASADVQNYRNGSHTSTKKCDEHWPNRNASKPNYYNFNASQSWCWWVVYIPNPKPSERERESVCVRACACICACMYIRSCIHTCIHVRIVFNVHKHTHTHTCIRTH